MYMYQSTTHNQADEDSHDYAEIGQQGADLEKDRCNNASLRTSHQARSTAIATLPTVADGYKCKIRIVASLLSLSIISNVILGSVIVWTSLKCSGTCSNPPKMKEECLYGNGRSYVQYTMLSRTSTPSSDHCPVSFCTGSKAWSEFKISSSTKECYTNSSEGAVYSGKNTCTETGRTCQRWNTDYTHVRHEDNIPTNPEDLRSNYCRDPGPFYGYKPWCYTTDPNVRWEYCHVPEC